MKIGDLVKTRRILPYSKSKTLPLRISELGIILEVKLSKEVVLDYRVSDSVLVFWPSIGCKWEWQKELEKTDGKR